MDGLSNMLAALGHAIRELSGEIKHQTENQKILCRIEKMEEKLDMKISDIKGDVVQIKAQLVKVFGEQQTRYDALAAKYAELQTQLEDAELDEQTASTVTEIKALLQSVDDSIPDVQPA